MRGVLVSLVPIGLLGAASGALAQNGPGAAPKPNSTIPEKVTPPTPHNDPDVTGTKGGVITPPSNVDPGMTKAPPAHGTDPMPVVKPKGGQPGTEPK